MMCAFKVLGIIIILLCDGVQNTELKGPHFLNLFERVLEPSPPLFESPSLRRPQEWASSFRNYWSSLIRNRLPIIGWGTTGTERPHLEEELEHAAEDMKNMDIDAPIITEKYDVDKVSSSVVPATAVEVISTNGEFMPVKVTEVKPSSGVTVTNIKFTNTPPVKVVSVPYTTLEIPLHPPAASYLNHDLQASTQATTVPTKQPSLLEILLEDYLCKSSSYSNCEYLVNIKHEQYPGEPHSPELPLVLKIRKPSTANNEKKGPYSNTPAPHFQVNIKDILGPEAYSATPLKPQHHASSSYTPIRTSFTTGKEVTTNAATTPYTPVDTTKHTTQASYTTTPARDKTSSYAHSKIPEVTTYSKMKKVTTEASTTPYIPVDVTEYTSKASYTTLPSTEKHHETTSYPKTDSSKVSSYSSNVVITEVVTTQQTPADIIEYTTKASYTTIPSTHYHEETTTHPSTYTIIPTTYHEKTTTHPSTYTTTPTTHYHKETTTHPSTYTTTHHEETTTHPSKAIPYYSTFGPIKETDSASTSYTTADKIELTSQASYTTVPTIEYHHETSSHTPVDVTKVSAEDHTIKIPVRYNDRLTNLNSPIKHSSGSSYTTVAADTSKYTTTEMPQTSNHASLTTTPQRSTTGIKTSYTPKATTELTGVYTTPTPSSEKYAISTVESIEKFTTNSPYSESTVTSAGPQATLSELSYDRPLTVALNDNSDQQIEDVPKKQTHPSESVPSIPQPPYNMSPYYAPSNYYPNIPYSQQGVWNYGNVQGYPYPYYFPHM